MSLWSLGVAHAEDARAAEVTVTSVSPCPVNAGMGGQGTTSTSDGLSQAGHGCVVIVYGGTTEVFTYTGSVQTWTVPAGVTSARVHLVGAGGGGAVRAGAGNGGGGGYATGDLHMVPGWQYQIIVGGGGRHQCVTDHTTSDVFARRNSSFGGGAAGFGAIGFNCSWASGGGRSALRLAGEDDDIVTAGGGGGGGFSSDGGAGGGLIGATGGPAFNGRAATGGTQNAGGLGGDGNEPAYPGERHLGGPAGFDLTLPSEGGGGGGGWYGGGGGGNNGGGGGGSSRIDHPGLASGCTTAGTGRFSGGVSASATSAPTVTGTAGIGSTLTAHPGTWSCHLTREFQWQTSPDGSTWTDVTGSNSSSYTITSTGLVRVRETATNLFGSGVTQSAALAVTVDTALANLTVSEGTMTPAFSPTVFAYTVTVSPSVTSVSVTPTRNHSATMLTVDGVGVASGSPSGPITLNADTTTVSVLATNTGLVTTTSVLVVRLAEPPSAPPAPQPVLLVPGLELPESSPTTVATASPATTTAPTTTHRPPVSTTPPTPRPQPNPVPTPEGVLPDLPPGGALLIAGPRTVTLEAFIEGGTDFVTQLSDRSVGLRLSAQCGSGACPLAVARDGRMHVRATPDGTVTVEGYGFRPGTLVHVWIFSTPHFLGSLGVASDGTFLGTLPIGATTVGEHTLQANGVRDDGEELSVNLGLSIGLTNVVNVRLPATGARLSDTWTPAAIIVGVGLALTSRRRRTSPTG